MSWSVETSKELLVEMFTKLLHPGYQKEMNELAVVVYEKTQHKRHNYSKSDIERFFLKASEVFSDNPVHSIALINFINRIVISSVPLILLSWKKSDGHHCKSFDDLKRVIENKIDQKLKEALLSSPLNAWLDEDSENLNINNTHDFRYLNDFDTALSFNEGRNPRLDNPGRVLEQIEEVTKRKRFTNGSKKPSQKLMITQNFESEDDIKSYIKIMNIKMENEYNDSIRAALKHYHQLQDIANNNEEPLKECLYEFWAEKWYKIATYALDPIYINIETGNEIFSPKYPSCGE